MALRRDQKFNIIIGTIVLIILAYAVHYAQRDWVCTDEIIVEEIIDANRNQITIKATDGRELKVYVGHQLYKAGAKVCIEGHRS